MKSTISENDLFAKSIGWDIENWKKSLLFFDSKVKISNSFKVLELGAGSSSGGYTHYYASKGLDVICSDFPKIDSKIKNIHLSDGLDKNISYESINAMDIPYKETIDIIVFKSLLGGIGRHNDLQSIERVMDSIYGSLKCGGYVMFAENMSATFFHSFFRKYWGNGRKGWTYLNFDGYYRLVKDRFQKIEYTTTGFLGCFGRGENQKYILGKLDQNIFQYIVPYKLNYIFICVAQKL